MLSPERRNRDSPLTASLSRSYSSNLGNINMDDDISESKSKFRRLIGASKDGRIDLIELAFKLLKSAKEAHSIEFLMFFHMSKIYIDRLCRLDFKFPDEVCRETSGGICSVFQMYRNIVEALIPVLFALFLGPFVDRNGTKLPILLSLSGYTIASLMYCVASFFPSIPAPYLLICSVPISVTGGLVAFLLAAFTHISTRSTPSNRSFRIAVLEGSWFLGIFGFQIASKIFKVWGFVPVFFISALSFAVALLYGIYYIHEPAFKSIQNSTFSSIFYEIFDLRSLKDTMATVFRPRSGPRRKWVILLMVTIFMRMLALFGTMQVGYLYTRNKFQWDATNFSTFSTIDTVICLSGGLFTLLMMKIFDLSDPVVGMFSAVGFVCSNIVFGSAGIGQVMYLGAVVQMFSGLITIVMRSMVSKCVAKDELAKAFSFVSIGEACMPILAGLLFNLMFRRTVHTFPGAVFFLSALFHSFILCSFIYFYFSSRKYPFQSLVEEQAIDPSSNA
ncbi:Proton-coupled folate transporter [Orchesella cincta]|uniref:Proton-coupled folate transporter n=1 Tax=Orchesella cincta TaxID=48709 RepID=A0A1D2MYM2_ORCCI|nr:Proton-coupled folate transporter [Orchesella cincta]